MHDGEETDAVSRPERGLKPLSLADRKLFRVSDG